MNNKFENHLVFCPEYQTDLSKYGIQKEFALDRGVKLLKKLKQDYKQDIFCSKPEKISMEDIQLVHHPEYIKSLSDPKTWLSIFEFKVSEYSPDKAQKPLQEIFEDFRIKSGGTLLAARKALKHGLTANLGGGYHHAMPARGQGFCAINDIAIAIKVLKKENLIKKALIVDLDFHQGDGTALAFADDHDVFTLSVHSQEGWPDEKQKSNLDVEIEENQEHLYLKKTEDALATALSITDPDLTIFVAGSDPYEKDVLPGSKYIKLSLEQMIARDKLVIDTFFERQIPLAMVFAGGYGPHVWEVHYHAVKHLLAKTKSLSLTKSI